MPELSRFYGIVVRMYFKDHVPPHVHAEYGGSEALFSIATGELFAGDLPRTARRLVEEWVKLNAAQLQDMWDSKDIMELPPLD